MRDNDTSNIHNIKTVSGMMYIGKYNKWSKNSTQSRYNDRDVIYRKISKLSYKAIERNRIIYFC